MKDLSKITPAKPDQGKAQWVEGQIIGIAKNKPTPLPRRFQTWLRRSLLLTSATLLMACGSGSAYLGVPVFDSSGQIIYAPIKVAAPQIVYRIDENRYFENFPRTEESCNSSSIYYVDKNKGIKTFVTSIEKINRFELVIDAANNEYLAINAPHETGSCYTCGGTYMLYSKDSGRSWQTVSPGADNNIIVTGSMVYDYGASITHADYENRKTGHFIDLSQPEKYAPYMWVPFRSSTDPKWSEDDYPWIKEKREKYISEANAISVFNAVSAPKIASAPQPKIAPIDTEFHCTKSPKIVFKIDKNRYFETFAESLGSGYRTSGLNYIDNIEGIRARVIPPGIRSEYIMDFAIEPLNKDYLVSPFSLYTGEICRADCDGNSGEAMVVKIIFSSDGGKTWQTLKTKNNSAEALSIRGSYLFSINKIGKNNVMYLDNPCQWKIMKELNNPRFIDLSKIHDDVAWKTQEKFPSGIQPGESRINCGAIPNILQTHSEKTRIPASSR